MTAGSEIRCKEGRDGGIIREKWARRRDLRNLLWTHNSKNLNLIALLEQYNRL